MDVCVLGSKLPQKIKVQLFRVCETDGLDILLGRFRNFQSKHAAEFWNHVDVRQMFKNTEIPPYFFDAYYKVWLGLNKHVLALLRPLIPVVTRKTSPLKKNGTAGSTRCVAVN